jgi:hypothetical protein
MMTFSLMALFFPKEVSLIRYWIGGAEHPRFHSHRDKCGLTRVSGNTVLSSFLRLMKAFAYRFSLPILWFLVLFCFAWLNYQSHNIKSLNKRHGVGMVAHTHNPSNWEGTDRRIALWSQPRQKKNWQDHIWKKNVVVHACNPSYVGGRDRRPDLAKMQDAILKTKNKTPKN